MAWRRRRAVQYCADTPDGAWAEFVRHEGITQESEIVNVRRSLWAIELPDNLAAAPPALPIRFLIGGRNTYKRCQKEARRLRRNGVKALRVISAALLPAAARGWKVTDGLQPGPARDGFVLVLFGSEPDAVGWTADFAAHPRADLLTRVRHLPPAAP
jgi:hypothetical protein